MNDNGARMPFKGKAIRVRKGYVTVLPALCKGCGLCMARCPQSCIGWSDVLGVYGTPSVLVDDSRCILCGNCELICPDCAIAVTYVPKPQRGQPPVLAEWAET